MSRHHGEQAQNQPFANFSPQQISGLTNKLFHAPQRELYKLSFQATVSFNEDGKQLYELRTRLLDDNSSLPAAAFLETVNQNALGEALDRWVIEQAIALLEANADGKLRLTVNLTQNSLVSPSFLTWLKTAVAESSRVIPKLILQISELDVLIAQHHMEYFCHSLNNLGIRLSISHFGSTEDPIRYLPLISAHYIKLDHSLTRLAEVDHNRQRQLGELIGNIHDRGMKVIAPMVEQIGELPVLWEAKVDFIQGYCLHKPGSKLNFKFIINQELTVN